MQLLKPPWKRASNILRSSKISPIPIAFYLYQTCTIYGQWNIKHNNTTTQQHKKVHSSFEWKETADNPFTKIAAFSILQLLLQHQHSHGIWKTLINKHYLSIKKKTGTTELFTKKYMSHVRAGVVCCYLDYLLARLLSSLAQKQTTFPCCRKGGNFTASEIRLPAAVLTVLVVSGLRVKHIVD